MQIETRNAERLAKLAAYARQWRTLKELAGVVLAKDGRPVAESQIVRLLHQLETIGFRVEKRGELGRKNVYRVIGNPA